MDAVIRAIGLGVLLAVLVVVATERTTAAQPSAPVDALRDGNAAATAGDWAAVTRLVTPLVGRGDLRAPELAEAHRLAGLAAFFEGRREPSENHFVAYLRLDQEGQLDPALYPPDVILFFNDVRARHPEIRQPRPKPRRTWALNLVPPFGQFQNGDRTKGWIIGGALATFAVTNLTTYFVLRSWCTRVSGDSGGSATCDEGGDRAQRAEQLRTLNLATGVAGIVTLGIGIYDGFAGYRRVSRRERLMQAFVAGDERGWLVGVGGSF